MSFLLYYESNHSEISVEVLFWTLRERIVCLMSKNTLNLPSGVRGMRTKVSKALFIYLKQEKRGNFMKYQVQENCLTIFLPTELDHHNAEEIRKNADSLIEQHQIKCVIFDFTDTNFMDSSGIGVIMGRYRLVYLLGGEVWVIHANERMKKILTMSGVTRIIQIYEEEKV